MKSIPVLHRWVLGAILLFVGCVGLLAIHNHGGTMYLGSFTTYNNDDVRYIRSAQTLFKTGVFSYWNPKESTVFIMPMLPIVVGACLKLFGFWKGLLAYRLLSLFLLMVTIVLIYLICRRIFPASVGLFAAALYALYLPNYWLTNVILTEILGQFGLWLTIWLGIVAVQTKKLSWFAACAAALSFAIYVRPNFALIPLVFLAYMLLQRYEWKALWKPMVVVASVMVLLMSPWWIRNAVTFHKFIPLTKSSGNPMMLGAMLNFQYPAGAETALRDVLKKMETAKGEIASDEAWVEAAKAVRDYGFQTQPKVYWKHYTIERVAELIKDPCYWSPILGISMEAATGQHRALVLIGFLGLLASLWRKDRRKSSSIILLLLAYFVVTAIPFVTFSRYGYVVMPMMTIYAAYLLHLMFPGKRQAGAEAGNESA